MIKKTISLLILPLIFTTSIYAQLTEKNIPRFDNERWHMGAFVGAAMYDFRLIPTELGMTKNDVVGVSVETSNKFTVGFIFDYKINYFLNIRVEPGITFLGRRKLTYSDEIMEPNTTGPSPKPKYDDSNYDIDDNERNIKTSYYNLPILIKLGGKRKKNFRPYVIGGINPSISIHNIYGKNDTEIDSKDFKMKDISLSWDAGLGIDWYLPYAKVSTEIRGTFSILNEFIPLEKKAPWTSSIDVLKTRGIFFVIKVESPSSIFK